LFGAYGSLLCSGGKLPVEPCLLARTASSLLLVAVERTFKTASEIGYSSLIFDTNDLETLLYQQFMISEMA
jgi:hypothetical protein